MVEYKTLEALLMSPEEELSEVLNGNKKSALGNWNDLPSNVLSINLFPVWGRYYPMGIALTQENLDELTLSYYAPVCAESDIRLGKILGYDLDSIEEYISSIDYDSVNDFNEEQQTILKFKSLIQKNGLKHFKEIIQAAMNGDELVLSIFLKELT